MVLSSVSCETQEMLSSNTTCQETSIDAVILSATNPLVKHEDPSAVQAVVQAVCRDTSAAAAAVRILAHKIHSPQQREAMKALSVVQACIVNCGPVFHCEIGKFRFLNEMIKLVSPKFAGQVTSSEIKSRVLELLYCWSRDLTEEPKIAEAYNMLKKQGIVKADPAYIGPLFAPAPAPRPPTSTIEDSERSEQLQRLLQSKRPEDLDRANALIQAMVRDDQRRAERANNTLMELEMARNNVKVLDEMLSEHEQRACDPTHVSLMTELHSTCTRLRNSLYQTIAQSNDTSDDHMRELIAVNEDLTRVMGRYKLLVEVGLGGVPPAVGVAPTGGAAAGEALLDLSSPKKEQRAPLSSGATADLVQEQLNRFGLADEPPPVGSPTAPPSAILSSAASLLQELDSTALTGPSFSSDGGVLKDLHPTGGLATPLIPLSTPQSVSEPFPSAPPPPASAMDPLTELSSNLLHSVLPPNAPPLGRSFAPPTKLSMNQMKLMAGASKAAPGSTSACLTKSSGHLKEDSATSCIDLENPNLAGSTPGKEDTRTNKNVPNGDLECLLNGGHDGGCKEAGLSDKGAGLNDGDASISDEGAGLSDKRPAGGVPSLDRAQFLEVKPLTDIVVTIDSIQPGSRAPVTLIETGTVSVTLHHTLNTPRPDVSVYVLTTTSRSVAPLTQYLTQACVPRACRVLLLPPSGTRLPQYSPFLPPPAVTQVLLVANPNAVNVSLKLMLSYNVGGDTVTEMAEVANLEI